MSLVGAASAAAQQHDWIHKNYGYYCCQQGEDCREVAAKITPFGFVFLNPFGLETLFVPIREAKPSLDGKFWACLPNPPKVRCFFAPPMGS